MGVEYLHAYRAGTERTGACVIRRKRRERELDDEIRAHFRMAAEDGIDARREFGNIGLIKEVTREMWGWASPERVAQDVRYGLRMMRCTPALSTVAVLSLALGIGANTAIFSLMDEILLRMLPVERPQELERVAGTFDHFSYVMYRELRDQNHVFSGLLARNASPVTLIANGHAERAVAELASINYFSVLGVRLALGRAFADGDRNAVVVSFHYWRERLSADPAIIGTTLRVNNYPFTVIGVAPPGFPGVEVGSSPDVFVPIEMQPEIFDRGTSVSDTLENTGFAWLALLGRRFPDISEAQARAGLSVTFHQIIADGHHKLFRDRKREYAMDLAPGGKGISRLRGQFENPLILLMSVVALVLLIACTNIANLLLARSAARRKEIAARLALGAPRLRLIRQLLTESALLGVIGGTLGFAFAIWGVRFMVGFLPTGGVGAMLLPLKVGVHVDERMLGFAIALSITTGILFGLAPAIQATRPDVAGALKDDGSSSAGGSRRFGLRNILVSSQVALSFLLLMGAGLFLKSLRNLSAIDVGLKTENVLVASMNPDLNGYAPPQIANFYRELQSRVARLPGVQSVGFTDTPLLASAPGGAGFRTPNRTRGLIDHLHRIGGDFFDATGVQIVRGRGFGPQDTASSPRVIIISESTAKYFYPDEDPIGRKVWVARMEGVEIIGVARDSKYRDVREKTPRTAYISFDQDSKPNGERTAYMRTAANPLPLIALLRREVQALDDNLPLYNVKTFAQQKAESLAQERMTATLSGFFGSLALLLASIGLYGVMAYSVQRRTREIGIRLSLGAGRARVARMVLRDSMLMMLAGLAIGIPASLWLSRLVASQLFGVKPGDPATMVTSALLLIGVAMLASYLPAYRASRVDPIRALRHE